MYCIDSFLYDLCLGCWFLLYMYSYLVISFILLGIICNSLGPLSILALLLQVFECTCFFPKMFLLEPRLKGGKWPKEPQGKESVSFPDSLVFLSFSNAQRFTTEFCSRLDCWYGDCLNLNQMALRTQELSSVNLESQTTRPQHLSLYQVFFQ